jgi:glyoxylase-like metal-dependent hydrolase (beta-lactamase superfamily II)
MIARLRAGNPSPLTLSGTNTYVVDGAWVVDPGPSLPAHLDAVVAAVPEPAGIVLTHSHADHAEGAAELAGRLGVPLTQGLSDGDTVGPFTALHHPGHTDDHFVFVAGAHAFTGDAVLGEGSVFVSGRLREYLAGLARLRALGLERIHPGHGDEIDDPDAKLDEYLAHRAERERKLVAALEAGIAPDDEDGLLDAAWADAPAAVRPFAAVTLRAHLQKLREEGRLGVSRGA